MDYDIHAELDDPLWDFILAERLGPYIEPVREWWKHVHELTVQDTGSYAIKDAPPGLMFRFTRSAVKSPIMGVQAFPFVTAGYLQLSGVKGGSTKMVNRICTKGFTIEEFTIIEKHNLPSTYNQGQFIAFVPTEYLEAIKQNNGAWIYITRYEASRLLYGIVPKTLKNKVLLRL